MASLEDKVAWVLQSIASKYGVNVNQKSQPVEIPNATREDLAKLFHELGYTMGAEVGVERGIYSEVLLKNNPGMKLFSIDAWEVYDTYRDHMEQKEMDEIHRSAVERLAPYNCTVIKGFSVEQAELFEDESLDFVYLDGNHEFVEVVKDIAAWEKKVKVGGIISGHDYIKRKTNAYLMHVPYALHGYVDAYQIKPLFVLGRKEVKANTNPDKGELRDSTRSWFYVKTARPAMIPGKPNG